jgi:flagellar motor switch protein FliN/FliY
MNVAASKVVVEGFLKGCFDVLGALFTRSFGPAAEMFNPSGIREVSREALEKMLSDSPLAFGARLKGKGAVAMLFTVGDGARFAALAVGDEPAPKETLSDSDLSTLKEAAASCLGGGVSNLMTVFGLGPEHLEDVRVSVGVAAADDLAELLGDEPVAAPFTFSSPPEFDGAGALLFSSDIEDMVPNKLVGEVQDGAVKSLAANARLSEAEMSDILSGFSPVSEEEMPTEHAAGVPAARGAAVPVPHNLEMILDIKLTAVARLGRIEMPIGNILELGPGSIIEVGHLVDEPIELVVNDKLIARGDVVVVDEKFGLRITEIVSPQQRIESLR